MSLPKKDIIATSMVVLAVVVYLLWATDTDLLALGETRVAGLVILALGFIASAVAVVPGFDQLIHGSKPYLAGTSILGLGALAAGIVMLVSSSGTALTVVMAVLVVLWIIATVHHARLVGTDPHRVDDRTSAAIHR